MKALHLVAIPQLTGAAEPALDLIRGLRAAGAEVDLRIDTLRPGNLRELLERAGETVARDLVLSTKAGPIAGARDVLRLKKLLPRYDVVHVHLSHDHALAALALGGRERPILLRTVHAARVLSPGFGRGWVLKRARGLTVACENHRRALAAAHGIDPARVLVLPGSVDAARFHPDLKARALIRDSLQLTDEHFAIGCVARFQAGRRHEVMLEAFAQARARAPGLRLLLIGHGETEDRLRESAGEGVIFPGYKREDLNSWLAALDAAIWLVPGNDATSRAVLQAMAVGLPVIGGDVDAIAEMVVHERTGLLADPDDPRAVADAMVALAADRTRAREWGASGKSRALSVYEPNARARRALDFYEELLKAHAAGVVHRSE